MSNESLSLLRGLIGLCMISPTAGCAQLSQLDLHFQEAAVIPNGGLLAGQIFEEEMLFVLFDEPFLEEEGVSKEDINSVQLTQFELNALTPEDADLSFIESVSVYCVEPESENWTLLAAQDTFPEQTPAVEFTLEDVDLSSAFLDGALSLAVDVAGALPEEDIEVEAALTLTVDVRLRSVIDQLRSE